MSTPEPAIRTDGPDAASASADVDNPPDQRPVEVLVRHAPGTPGSPGAHGTPGTPGGGQPGTPVDAEWVRRHLDAALAHVAAPAARVTVAVVGDRAMADLHRRWRGEPGTTDVLTFPQSPPGAPIDADIVVCADEARRRAGAFGHAVEREILLYALHGVLHCAGFDDGDDDGFRRMHAEEDRILAAIGVGPTFTPGERGRG